MTRPSHCPAPPSPRRYARFLAAATVAVFAAIYALSGICYVKPEQQALVTRFGKLRPVALLPGTHYRLPYPIDRVTYSSHTP